MTEPRPLPLVHEVAQAVIEDDPALSREWLLETPAAITVTPGCWLIETLLAEAEMVLAWAVVEFRSHVATPLPLAVWVSVDGDEKVLFSPEAAIVTDAFGTGLPIPSLAVTVISV